MTYKRRKKKKTGLKVFLTLIIFILVIAIAVAYMAYKTFEDVMGKINKVDIDTSLLSVSSNEKLNDYLNIAVFGLDSRKDDYGKGNRSDCIMVVSINKKTNDVNLLSVYRDTYLLIDENGEKRLDKATHAYSYGEAPTAIKMLNENLDLNIKHFVTVNFDSVAEAVDRLGGIDMEIEDDEIDYMNSYINHLMKVTGKKSTHIKSSGKHHLDGVQAVAYSRIRYTSGGDFKRTQRIRSVFIAMGEALKEKNIFEIKDFADVMLGQIYSNIDSADALTFIKAYKSLAKSGSKGWPYEDSVNTKTINGVSYVIPVTLESNVIQFHKEVFSDTDYKLPESIKKTSDEIVYLSGYNK